ncbi:MAG: 16S rRNA (uracil(1498)-N(3))-methyltransferase, partial [Planctomycetaceae bacterium]
MNQRLVAAFARTRAQLDVAAFTRTRAELDVAAFGRTRAFPAVTRTLAGAATSQFSPRVLDETNEISVPPRFYVPEWTASGRLLLTGPEARHLAVVLRARPGDSVVVFDGRGREADARVCQIGSAGVEIELGESRLANQSPARQITLAVAVPKGDRFAWLIEKATEIGVDRLIPLLTQRSIVEPGAGKLDRMRRTIVEASKQCRRSQLMELGEVTPWNRFL